jgi:hypothetical protein
MMNTNIFYVAGNCFSWHRLLRRTLVCSGFIASVKETNILIIKYPFRG